MIRIVLCLKQVAYLYSRMGIDSRGRIDPDGVAFVTNPFDEIALEEALRIKQRIDQAEITLISMGPPRVEEALRYGLAMGADRAIHIFNPDLENLDPSIRSNVLAKVIETQGFDLILCGKKAIDDNEGVVGGFIAEKLGLPYVGSVTEIMLEPGGRRAQMLQVLERGDRQLIECELPALLTVERGLTRPRYPTLKGRLLASQKEVLKVALEELGIRFPSKEYPGMKVAKLSILRPKPKKIFAPSSSLSAQEKIKLVMSGGLAEKKSNFLKGSYQELARQFIDFLEENRIIRRRHGSGRTN